MYSFKINNELTGLKIGDRVTYDHGTKFLTFQRKLKDVWHELRMMSDDGKEYAGCRMDLFTPNYTGNFESLVAVLASSIQARIKIIGNKYGWHCTIEFTK